jgi:antitoxin VapB
MPLNIRNEVVNHLARKLAARKHLNKTDAVKLALENELRRMDEALPLRDRLRPLQDRVLARPATGLDADKAFYDEVSGHPIRNSPRLPGSKTGTLR